MGGLVGAFDATMAHANTPWFPGMNTTHARLITGESLPTQYTSIQNESAQTIARSIDTGTSESTAGDVGTLAQVAALGFVLWDTFKGVFYVKSIIDASMPVANVQGGMEYNNLASIFTTIVQLGIWIVYAMGAVQYYKQVMLKYAY